MFLTGIACAVGAGLLWGLTFVAPLLLPTLTPLDIASGRFVAYGLSSLALLAVMGRDPALPRGAWGVAFLFAMIGNILYFLAQTAAIRLAGPALPTLIIGTLPVTIAVAGALRDRDLPLRALLTSTALILAGLFLAYHEDRRALAMQGPDGSAGVYLLGTALAVAALALWTCYGVANARYLKRHSGISSLRWAGMLGVAGLPPALAGLAWSLGMTDTAATLASAGTLGRFVLVSLLLGLASSWAATWLWNRASALLPTSLAGQLIVAETLAALLYAYLLDGRAPRLPEALGAALLVAGVLWSVRAAGRQASPEPA